MLQRLSSDPAPNRWQALRQDLAEGHAALLLRYCLILALIVALGSLYFWQLSAIADMETRIVQLNHKAERLETRNATLAVEASRWTGPGIVEAQAAAAGMEPATKTVRVTLPATGRPESIASSTSP